MIDDLVADIRILWAGGVGIDRAIVHEWGAMTGDVTEALDGRRISDVMQFVDVGTTRETSA